LQDDAPQAARALSRPLITINAEAFTGSPDRPRVVGSYRIGQTAGVRLIAADAPPERQFAIRWTLYIDTTGKIAMIENAVKPATSGQDIVTNLGELKVPERK
jgi:hypothetical protein